MTDDDEHSDRQAFAGSFAHRAQALEHLAFGVSSTPRATQRPVPVVIDRAEGVTLTDVDGRTYTDYALGYGPLILGHSPAPVLAAIQAALMRGLRTASVHRGEAELAARLAACVPGVEVSSFVSTGTEAVLLALRIARAATGRTGVVKFRANYHGWGDSLQVGTAMGQDGPGTLGQDPHASEAVTLLDWGDADAVERVLDHSHAAVIVEPAAINGGCFEPPPGFLARLRDATRRCGALLIFDEVITGFRFGLGGAQARYGVVPDLSVLGKALGAGLPISAVGGTRAAMAVLAEGRLMHRGTFNGNPVCVAAALACLDVLADGTIFPRMDGFAARLSGHVNAEAARLGLAVQARAAGPAFQIFAASRPIGTLADTVHVDREGTVRVTEALLKAGMFTLPRGLCYLSAAHTSADIARTEAAITAAFEALAWRRAA